MRDNGLWPMRWNKPFPSKAASGHDVYHSHGKPTTIIYSFRIISQKKTSRMSKRLGVSVGGCCIVGGGGCCYASQTGLHLTSGFSRLYFLSTRIEGICHHTISVRKIFKEQTNTWPCFGIKKCTHNGTKNSRKPGIMGKLRQEDHELETRLKHIKTVSKK